MRLEDTALGVQGLPGQRIDVDSSNGASSHETEVSIPYIIYFSKQELKCVEHD